MSLNLMVAAATITTAISLPHNSLAAACPQPLDRTAYVMGTTLRLTVCAADRPAAVAASERAFAEVRRLERVLSSWQSDSEIGRLNHAGADTTLNVSPELGRLLSEAGAWVRATDGAFDPAIGALIDVWGFRTAPTRPDTAAIARALRSSGWTRLQFEAGATIRRGPAGWWLDTGGFGKGAALRAAIAVLQHAHVRSATLDFGGQVATFGDAVPVRVADPRFRARPVRSLNVRNVSVATSSQSERFIEIDGRRYGHVLDPRTGEPVPAWGSVTVVAADAFTADALSTALFVMGPERALAWAEQHPDIGVLVLTVEPDATVRAAWSRTMNQWIQEN